jgi:enamine deaminase RidA (YjgF/YER057c/UK114 family)
VDALIGRVGLDREHWNETRVSVHELGELIGLAHAAPEAPGIRVEDLVYGCGITGRDRRTRECGSGTARQADDALSNVDSYLRGLGGSLDNVARVSFFLRDPRDLRKVNEAWTARFPSEDNRPTYKFMGARLGDTEEVRLDFFAVLGQARKCLYLPTVAHGNPIPMAVQMGRYLFSSRILPFDPATGEPGREGAAQARFAALNADAVLELAGMSWSAVTQGRAFVADPDHDQFVRAEWARRFGTGAAAPLHVTRYRAGALAVLLEVIAVDQRDRRT